MSTFLIAGLGLLVIVYMTYPRFQRKRLSAARFFFDLPKPKKGQSRLRFGKIKFTLPFLLQFLLLLALLAALYLMEQRFAGEDIKGLGVWVVVDTSASMSTQQLGKPRMDAALKEVKNAIEQAQESSKEKEICFRLSALDLERRDLLVKSDALTMGQAANNLEARPLGTDLGILRRLVQSLKDQDQIDEQCRVSHIVFITDQPAPEWLAGSSNVQVVWRDISQPVPNIGFTGIDASRDPLTGLVSAIQLEITTYGPPPSRAKVSVIAPDGSKIKDQALLWQRKRFWRGSFAPTESGQYTLQVSLGGGYAFDDKAIIEIGKGQQIRVDWQLKDRNLFRQLGWSQDNVTPQLRVTSQIPAKIDVPTLIVGSGYSGLRNSPAKIRDFVETSPLLMDVNFDAVETISLQNIQVPGTFEPVLRGMDGSVWLAQAEKPVSAIVPGLPTGGDDVIGRFSATVFFNAVRWLLKKQDLSPLYTLTSPQNIQPTVNNLVLHPGEGNTYHQPQSSGKLSNLTPVAGKGRSKPMWPILLMTAAVLFLIERAISFYRLRN
jgi:hypothetical protein